MTVLGQKCRLPELPHCLQCRAHRWNGQAPPSGWEALRIFISSLLSKLISLTLCQKCHSGHNMRRCFHFPQNVLRLTAKWSVFGEQTSPPCAKLERADSAYISIRVYTMVAVWNVRRVGSRRTGLSTYLDGNDHPPSCPVLICVFVFCLARQLVCSRLGNCSSARRDGRPTPDSSSNHCCDGSRQAIGEVCPTDLAWSRLSCKYHSHLSPSLHAAGVRVSIAEQAEQAARLSWCQVHDAHHKGAWSTIGCCQ